MILVLKLQIGNMLRNKSLITFFRSEGKFGKFAQ